jgi:hypothetical protein
MMRVCASSRRGPELIGPAAGALQRPVGGSGTAVPRALCMMPRILSYLILSKLARQTAYVRQPSRCQCGRGEGGTVGHVGNQTNVQGGPPNVVTKALCELGAAWHVAGQGVLGQTNTAAASGYRCACLLSSWGLWGPCLLSVVCCQCGGGPFLDMLDETASCMACRAGMFYCTRAVRVCD